MAGSWANSWASAWAGSWGWATQLEAGRRSGVIRLWLAQLTAELNGMVEKEEQPEPVVEAVAAPLEPVTENVDGSATVGTESKPKRVKQTTAPEPAPFNKPINPVDIEKYKKRDLPLPHEFASFLFQNLATEAKNQVWAEQKVLEALRQAAEEAEEEELLLEAAVKFLF